MSELKESDFVEMREEIVAYLDGELTPEQVAVVERRLAGDDGYRHELLQLQKTWDLLDQIPHTTASSDFTRSTVEMAAVKERKVQRKKWLRSLNWRWIAAALAVLCCVALGYATSYEAAMKPNRELTQDLGLLHGFEMFEEVDSIAFLERLDGEGLFANEAVAQADEVNKTEVNKKVVGDKTVDGSKPSDKTKNADGGYLLPASHGGQTTLADLEQMDDGQLYQLKLKKEKFEKLSVEDQERHRSLYQLLRAHPNHDRLSKVLMEYNDWLASVDGKQRAELAGLPVDDRIEQVKRIRRRQAVEQLGFYGEWQMTGEDLAALSRWLDEIARQKREEVAALARESWRRGSPSDQDEDSSSRRMIDNPFFIRMALVRLKDETGRKIVSAEEIEKLSQSLSPEGAKIVAQAVRKGELFEFLRSCTDAMWQSRTTFSEEELQQFFEQKLTSGQQSAMDWMTPDDRYTVLVRAYIRYGLNNEDVPEDWKPDGFQRGGGRQGRSGPGGGGPSGGPGGSGPGSNSGRPPRQSE